MKDGIRNQLVVLFIFLAVLTLLSFLTYALVPLAQFLPASVTTPTTQGRSPTLSFALAAAGSILLLYGATGLAGFWFARKLVLPATYRENATWRDWVLWPTLMGIVLGILLVLTDTLIASATHGPALPHPPFPFSLVASATAAIGEEILFRSFVLGFWAFLLSLLLRRWNLMRLALWLGVVVSALAFSAAHLPSAMFLFGTTSPAELPIPVLAELVLLNTLLGLITGERYLRDGLVAAMAVHFWADIVWHVIWPLLGLHS